MAVCDITLVRKQVLEKLVAMPRAISQRYTDAIGEGSDYAVLQEITDGILLVDESICTDIISAPSGHPYASQFMTLSAALSNGDKVPGHIGSYGDVRVAVATVYGPSEEAKSRGDILRMIDNAALYGGPSRFHWIENNFIFHAGDQDVPSVKVYYPVFSKTAACQTPDNYTEVLQYGSIQIQQKMDSEAAFFKDYRDLYLIGRQMIKSGAEFIPPQQQLEAAMRRTG